MKWIVLAIVVMGLAGCNTLARATSGQIGCPEDKVEVYDQSTGWAVKNWKAKCNGKHYTCSAVGGSQYAPPQINCSPLGGAAAAPLQQGCAYDTQCKGERICVKGNCLNP